MDERKEAFRELKKKGLDDVEAATFAGYKPGYVPDTRPGKKIQKALEEKGVTDELIAEKVKDGLDATNRFGSKDHNAITKYLSLVGKWLGYEKADFQVSIGLSASGEVRHPDKLKEAIEIIETEITSRECEGDGNTGQDQGPSAGDTSAPSEKP